MAYEDFCPHCGSPLVSGACPQGTHAFDQPGSRFIGQWNWGAFCLCPLWLMNHGFAWYGSLFLAISLIPYVGALVCIPAAIYCGISGNKIAVKRRAFVDDAQFVAVQDAWRNWGIPIFLGSPAVLLFIVVVVVPRLSLY